jgi:hypothetical protein
MNKATAAAMTKSMPPADSSKKNSRSIFTGMIFSGKILLSMKASFNIHLAG